MRGLPPPLPIPHWSITERVEQLAHGLELQAGLAPEALTGPRLYLMTEGAAATGQRLFLRAHVGQALAHLSEAGGSDGPGTRGQTRIGHDASSGSWLATNQVQAQTLHPPCSVS